MKDFNHHMEAREWIKRRKLLPKVLVRGDQSHKILEKLLTGKHQV